MKEGYHIRVAHNNQGECVQPTFTEVVVCSTEQEGSDESMSQLPEETVFTYRDWRNPHLRLLEEFFERLGPPERIEHIGSALRFSVAHNLDDDAVVDLIRSLKVCFSEDGRYYRSYLRYGYPEFEYSTTDRGLAILRTPNLRERIFAEVIMGWTPKSEDAQECFTFLCSIYSAADKPVVNGADRKLRSIIENVFREHLKNSYIFTLEQLVPWVVREETPDEIARIILHGMVNTKDGDRPAGVRRMREILTSYQATR